jgi:hypothetical protein
MTFFPILLLFPLTLLFSVRASNVMLVSISMALHAIVVFADAFLDVFATNFFRRMLVTAIARVIPIVAAYVACHATDFVVTIQLEQFEVVESCRLPLLLAVALCTITRDVLMQ